MKEIIKNYDDRKGKILSRIRKIRQERKLSCEEVAENLGIDTSTYTRLENGKTHLRIETLWDIADVLETTDLYLLYGI